MNDIQPSTFRDGGCRQQLDLWIGSAGARRLLLLVLMRRAEPPRYLCTEYPSRIAAAPLAHLHAPPAMDQANGLMVLYFGLTVRPDTTPSSLVEPLHRRRRSVSAPSPALGPSSFYGRQIESALDSGDLRGQVASSPSRCRSRTGSQLGFDSTSSGQGQQRVTKLSCFGRNMLAATLWSVVSCRGRDAACVHSTQYVRTLLGGHAHCNLQVASQQPPKPPKCCPFSRLILGARGEAPWACACAPYPLLPHPPPSPGRLAPKPYHSPVCLLGRRTAWTRGADHFHTLILTPCFFHTTFLLRCDSAPWAVLWILLRLANIEGIPAFPRRPVHPSNISAPRFLVVARRQPRASHPVATRRRTDIASLVPLTRRHIPPPPFWSQLNNPRVFTTYLIPTSCSSPSGRPRS